MTDFANLPITWQHKGFGTDLAGRVGSELEASALSALDGDLPLPVMTLDRAAIAHNIDVMARFCIDNDVDLAPHAKTTMSPELVGRQRDAGAWGMTAATVAQARMLREFGIDTLVIASQVLDLAGIRWICETQNNDPSFFVTTLVDSVQSIAVMEKLIAKVSPSSRIRVLVELGYDRGRAGARTTETALAVARAASASKSLILTGVEGFEGMVPGDSVDARRVVVDAYLKWARAFVETCLAENLFENDSERAPIPLVTFGGSAFHDLVVRELAGRWAADHRVRIVLRSGCYVTHDHGLYTDTSPWSGGPHALRAAAEVWGVVLSTPEPGRAILGFGRRDVGSDAGFPIVLWSRRDGVNTDAQALKVTGLNDQHAYLDVPTDFDLQVGDLLGCGISHPCTTFDKWSLIPEVDADYRVLGTVHTFF
ncbi:D-serine dehydratase [Rhodococcus sp. 27YEA15]|uniref:alanine racemase n=1 Tax=Rhodococcus sp. 27YEA15 TaxID=3156259 RepID=UPI003C7D3DA6